MFKGIGFFKDTFLHKVKEDAKLYKMPPRCVAYTMHELFHKKLQTTKTADTDAIKGR